MAKFNLSRFNRAKYNRQADGAIVFDKARIDAVFLGQFGLGQKTIDAIQMAAVFSGQMQGAAGTLDSGQFDAIITHDIAVRYIAYGHDPLGRGISPGNIFVTGGPRPWNNNNRSVWLRYISRKQSN